MPRKKAVTKKTATASKPKADTGLVPANGAMGQRFFKDGKSKKFYAGAIVPEGWSDKP